MSVFTNTPRPAPTRCKGVLLAGGSGTRLYPLTRVVNKHLLPVFDKPMVYYPLSTLLLAGIRDILVISGAHDLPRFEALFGDGTSWGLSIRYAVQSSPDGIAQAFLIGEDFIGDDPVCLILGDNIFHGQDLPEMLQQAARLEQGAIIFAYYVNDPWRYGVVSFDDDFTVTDIQEKPARPTSNYAVTGLYFYGSDVVEVARRLKPSERGELEITDVNRDYLARHALNVNVIGRGTAWLDNGTLDSMLSASQYVQALEERQGLKICCPEEIAFRLGYIEAAQLERLARPLSDHPYGRYLLSLLRRP